MCVFTPLLRFTDFTIPVKECCLFDLLFSPSRQRVRQRGYDGACLDKNGTVSDSPCRYDHSIHQDRERERRNTTCLLLVLAIRLLAACSNYSGLWWFFNTSLAKKSSNATSSDFGFLPCHAFSTYTVRHLLSWFHFHYYFFLHCAGTISTHVFHWTVVNY